MPDLAVLFDLDGTLIDSEGLWWRAECLVVDGLGGTWTPQDQAMCLGGPLERVSAYMAQRSGSARTPDDIGRELLDCMEGLLRSEPLEWRPGARELLAQCRAEGIPTGLVSASHRRLLDAVDDAIARDVHARGDHAFDVTVAGDEVANGKPHPEPYVAAARMLGVPIERCIVLEDSPTGVESGQMSGAFVVAIPHIVAIESAERRRVIDTLAGVTTADLRAWRDA